jgi:hypothetical protein
VDKVCVREVDPRALAALPLLAAPHTPPLQQQVVKQMLRPLYSSCLRTVKCSVLGSGSADPKGTTGSRIRIQLFSLVSLGCQQKKKFFSEFFCLKLSGTEGPFSSVFKAVFRISEI